MTPPAALRRSVPVGPTGAVDDPPPCRPGDVVLGVARGRLKHRLIRRVQRSDCGGAHRSLAGFTHAALVVSGDGGLVEVSGGRLRRSHLREYATRPHRVFPITASDEVRHRLVARADDACARGALYDAPAALGIAVSALTGFALTLSWDGAHTCSGFVAHVLAATGARFDRDSAQVTPAQLASHLLRHGGTGAEELFAAALWEVERVPVTR